MQKLPNLQFLELILYKVNIDRSDVSALMSALRGSPRLNVLRLNIARWPH